MACRGQVVRVVAVLLLVLATAETILCAEWSPASCRFAQEQGDTEAHPHSGDSCLCCCPHLLIASYPVPAAVGVVESTQSAVSAQLISIPSPLIYHPPQA